MAATSEVHPIFEHALASIKPPEQLAGGAELAVHGDAEDVLAQIGRWVGRYGMFAAGLEYHGCFGGVYTHLWSLRQRELVADVTHATSLPGPAGECIDVYPEGGATPQIPIKVSLVRNLLLLGEPARYVATFELEGGD